MPHKTRDLLTIVAFLASVFAVSLAWAQRPSFDLSPEQTSRPHTDRNPAYQPIFAGLALFEPGTLTVGISDTSALPLSDYASDSRTLIGFHVDLAHLIAEKAGLKLKITPVAWADWSLGLSAGKFDAVISNVTVTEERKRKYDFATYRRDVLGFYVANNSKIQSVRKAEDIAGLNVMTDSGTNQELILLDWDRKNVAAGLPAIKVQYYDDPGLRNIALESGRADLVFSVNAALAYVSAVGGRTRLVGTVNGGWPLTADIGVALRKGSGLVDPVSAIINELIDEGSYQKIIDRWNLGDEVVERSEVNPPGLPETEK